MKNFTVFDKLNGRIIKVGSCPDSDFEFQAVVGQSVIEGTYPDNLYYWDNGFKEMPPKPQGFYDFDYATKSWVLNQDQTIGTNKSKRNSLLISSDWTQLPDVALTQAEKDHWKVYRQALRDMTEQDFLDGNFPIY